MFQHAILTLPIRATGALLASGQRRFTSYWYDLSHPKSLYFGCNVQDAESEQSILENVGSYGLQIHRILDAMVTVIDILNVDLNTLNASQQVSLLRLKALADEVDLTLGIERLGDPLQTANRR